MVSRRTPLESSCFSMRMRLRVRSTLPHTRPSASPRRTPVASASQTATMRPLRSHSFRSIASCTACSADRLRRSAASGRFTSSMGSQGVAQDYLLPHRLLHHLAELLMRFVKRAGRHASLAHLRIRPADGRGIEILHRHVSGVLLDAGNLDLVALQ